MTARFRSAFLLFLAACVGCAGTRAPAQTAEALSPSKMRIYLIRESKFVGGGGTFPVEIDGSLKIEIPNGSYYYIDLEPGAHELASEPSMLPGKFILSIEGVPGVAYYLLLTYRTSNASAGAISASVATIVGGPIVGSILGWSAQSAESGKDGPFRLVPLDAAHAESLMTELELRFRGGWPAL